MRLDDPNWTLNVLKNPLESQRSFLEDLQLRLGGEHVVVDPNNVAAFLLEACSTITALHSRIVQKEVDATYPLRAIDSKDLTKHISDFDYVGMYSTPSTTEVILTLDKNYLVNNAKSFNEVYSKVIIPAETVFTVGEYKFGIYYPIEIRINKQTGNTIAMFDTSEEHQLHDITQNIVPHTVQKWVNMELINLKIPVYQFTLTRIQEDLIPGQGWYKTYKYPHKFYALRVFNVKDGVRHLMHQSLSVDIYDPYTPTVNVLVTPENNSFILKVPQIYFTNGQMGNRLEVELYTTRGQLQIDISSISPSSLGVNYNVSIKNNLYSQILNTVPVNVVSIGATQINGGSNELSFEEKRNRVINNAFHASALITPMDMEAYFADTGFSISRYEDNLTNLMYHAHKILRDNVGGIVPTMSAYIHIENDTVDNVSHIRKTPDGLLTILPTCLYEYKSSSGTCVPVSDTSLSELEEMTRQEKVEHFNKYQYTKSPYHIRLVPDGRYSRANSYNLMQPKLDSLKFEKENDQITAQMVSNMGVISHLADGSGGYIVDFVVEKSKDLVNIPESDIEAYIFTSSIEGVQVGTKLNFLQMFEGSHVYRAHLDTNYNITREHHLEMTTLKDTVNEWNHIVPFEGKYTIVFMVKKEHFPTAITASHLYSGVAESLKSTHHVLLTQSCNIQLGYALDDVVYNNVNLSWSEKQYIRHEYDLQATYSQDIYRTDDNGVPVVVVNPETELPELVKLHKMGDPIFTEEGEPVWVHREGDIVYDDYNKPILAKDRVQIYYVNALMIDAAIYLSEQPTQQKFKKELPAILESYFTTIRSALDKLNESDKMYFRPTRTLGQAKFSIGDNLELTMPLNMSIKFKCHVPPAVVNDETTKDTLRESIISILEKNISQKTISLTELTSTIRESLDYIEAVDVLGINGMTTLQTIRVLDKGVQPSIRQELYLTTSNTIGVKKSIDIEFVAVA